MKKFLFSIVIAAALMTSCIKNEEVVKECNCDACNANFPSNTVAITTHYVTITPSEWIAQNNPAYTEVYTYVSVDDDAITSNVINDGVVLAYVVENQDELLPYSFPQDIYDTDQNLIGTIMQSYRYDVVEGTITFILEASDKNLYWPQSDLQFKIVILTPNY